MSSPDFKKRVLADEDLSLIASEVPALADFPGVSPWNRSRIWAAVLDALIEAKTKSGRDAAQQALGAIQALDAIDRLFVRHDKLPVSPRHHRALLSPNQQQPHPERLSLYGRRVTRVCRFPVPDEHAHTCATGA
ncbi:hypothetical protein WME75_13995 [Sorangium sp. So ce1014]|uniref:hypothetical protein n=1 Tax=Sorangium sp. So ce1014 TaxID=3133326 RepID=UPI003F5E9759